MLGLDFISVFDKSNVLQVNLMWPMVVSMVVMYGCDVVVWKELVVCGVCYMGLMVVI